MVQKYQTMLHFHITPTGVIWNNVTDFWYNKLSCNLHFARCIKNREPAEVFQVQLEQRVGCLIDGMLYRA